MNAKGHHRRGAVLAWTVIMFIALVGLVAVGTDVGWVVLSIQHLQTGADASALAGAHYVKTDQIAARDAAVNVAYSNKAAGLPIQIDRNDANDTAGDVVIGNYNLQTSTFTPDTVNPNAVRVRTHRVTGDADGAVPLTFARVFGVDTVNLAKHAIAITGGFSGGGIIVLDPDANCALLFSGNTTVTVTGGGIQVNSTANCGACDNGNPDIIVPEIYVAGGACIDSNDSQAIVFGGSPPVPDPLAGLPEPDMAALTVYAAGSADFPGGGTEFQTINPGIYPNGINRNGGTLTMNPGIYVIRAIDNGKGFNFNTAGIVANEVMIYLDNDLGANSRDARLDLAGGGNVELHPMTSGEYAGITIFQDRLNTEDAHINGNNELNVTGTIYFPNAHLHLNGTGDGFSNQIIANTVEFSGNSNITIPYQGTFPFPTNRPFLVE